MNAETDAPQAKYVFKARYGMTIPARPTTPDEEPSREDIDVFVRNILGLKKDEPKES